MRLEGTGRIATPAYQGRGHAVSGSGFALPSGETRAPATQSSAGLSSPALSALLELQSVDVTVERRRKAVSRGRNLLDLLDKMRLGVLDGALSPEALQGLKSALSEQRGETDDPAS